MLHTALHPLLITTLALALIWNPAGASAPQQPASPEPEAVSEAAPAQSDHAPLTPLTAHYGASLDKGVALDGSAVRTLRLQSDGSWVLRFEVESLFADIVEVLNFQWQDGRVIPLTYRYKLSGFMIRGRERALDYDWDKGVVSGRYEGESVTMDLPANALDPLGFQLQLRQDLKAGKTHMAYKVTDKGRYDEDEFAVIGEEFLDTRLGRVRAVKLEKVRAPDSKRETLMWFVPELDYLLVRLVQVEKDGSRYEINVEDATIAD